MEPNSIYTIDLHWFKNVPLATKLQCIICQSVPMPDIAYIHRQCGKLFCKNHIEEWFKSNCDRSCPFDRTKQAEIVLCKGNDQFVYSMLLELELKCPLSTNCSWVGTLETLQIHTLKCEFKAKPCQYQELLGCKYQGSKSELETHYEICKNEHLSTSIIRLKQEMQKNAELVKQMIERERSWTEEKRRWQQALEETKAGKDLEFSMAGMLAPASFRWDTKLPAPGIFMYSNGNRTVLKQTCTTYSTITEEPLPRKATWKISLEKVNYFEQPPLGFGIGTRTNIGSCHGIGGFLSCDGGIGVSVLNGLNRMSGTSNIKKGEIYVCEIDLEIGKFTIRGLDTNLTANVDPAAQYYIYAEFYKSGEQVTILLYF